MAATELAMIESYKAAQSIRHKDNYMSNHHQLHLQLHKLIFSMIIIIIIQPTPRPYQINILFCTFQSGPAGWQEKDSFNVDL